MQKKKHRFNVMDALILLGIFLAIFTVLYVFVFSEHKAGDALTNPDNVHLTYVVEISDLEEEYADYFTVGETVIDSSKKMNIGVITEIETQPYTSIGHDIENGALVLNHSDDRISMYVTIEADASLGGIGYAIGGYEVYVGMPVYLQLSDIICSGYCISLDTDR